MEATMENDTRGWIMCVVSGIACVFGASIICVDVLVRCIPSKKDFRIQDSNAFLAGSLSLSFGVMIFSSLYSMLPSSKKYLINSGLSDSNAAWILLGCFVGGFGGIQIFSKFLHNHIPSHVVDCDHSHKESSHDHDHDHDHVHNHNDGGGLSPTQSPSDHTAGKMNGSATESTPLIQPQNGAAKFTISRPGLQVQVDGARSRELSELSRRSSIIEISSRVVSFIQDKKHKCDGGGPCYGYSEPCGLECFKHTSPRTPLTRTPTLTRQNVFQRSTTAPPAHSITQFPFSERASCNASTRPVAPRSVSRESSSAVTDASFEVGGDHLDLEHQDFEAQHHHHVPENAFISIGLQTTIAIALHKLPEGFITYATNHANPSLGWSVFLALFFHNVTEGFALALPLYLAFHSRLKAMVWASLLGGLTQPLGAGIAAIWFKIAGHEGHEPDTRVYGCMFAITAGVMASVALSLFVEGLGLNHNRNLCILFAFVGMALMGLSNALTS